MKINLLEKTSNPLPIEEYNITLINRKKRKITSETKQIKHRAKAIISGGSSRNKTNIKTTIRVSLQ